MQNLDRFEWHLGVQLIGETLITKLNEGLDWMMIG